MAETAASTVPTSMTETAASMATAATVVTAAVAAAAARPRDATCLEPLVCFFFFFFFLFFPFFSFYFNVYFNVYFRSPQHIKTSMAATAAAARDTTCLESLVFIYL